MIKATRNSSLVGFYHKEKWLFKRMMMKWFRWLGHCSAALAVAYVSLIVSMVGLAVLFPALPESPYGSGVVSAVTLLLALGLLHLYARFVTKRPLMDYLPHPPKQLGIYLLFALAFSGVTYLVYWLTNDGKFVSNSYEGLLFLVSDVLGAGLCTSIFEEVIFRGFLQRESDAAKIPVTLSIPVLSILFASLHLNNYQGLDAVLFGLSLTLWAILVTLLNRHVGTIWLSIAIHAVHNGLIGVLDMAATNQEMSFFSYVSKEETLLSGGAAGSSASLVTSVVYLLAILIVLYYEKRTIQQS